VVALLADAEGYSFEGGVQQMLTLVVDAHAEEGSSAV
jgi:hypothetical protein